MLAWICRGIRLQPGMKLCMHAMKASTALAGVAMINRPRESTDRNSHGYLLQVRIGCFHPPSGHRNGDCLPAGRCWARPWPRVATGHPLGAPKGLYTCATGRRASSGASIDGRQDFGTRTAHSARTRSYSRGDTTDHGADGAAYREVDDRVDCRHSYIGR